MKLIHKYCAIFLALLFISPQKISAGDTKIGLHVGNINSSDKINADKIISNLTNMGVKSVRLIYQYPSTKEITAYSVKELNDNNIDVLITILPDASDYSDASTSYSNYPNGSSDFETLCGSVGWKWMYKYSSIDQSLYKIRIESLITEINRIGGKVTAFEIGNETDWACFNGDIPVKKNGSNSYDLSQTSFLSDTVTGYARTLKTSYESIKYLQPNASVLTFGAANTYLYDPLKPHINYPNFLLWLTNIGGINYLTTYSDATAMHFYPQTITSIGIAEAISPAFTNTAKYRNKFWITEFGFGKSLPQLTTSSGSVEASRLFTYHNFFKALDSLNQITIERAYLYSYEQSDWTIMSPDSSPLLSAQIFKQYIADSPPSLPGDLNGDGKVNLYDYTELIRGFGTLYFDTDFINIITNYGR